MCWLPPARANTDARFSLFSIRREYKQMLKDDPMRIQRWCSLCTFLLAIIFQNKFRYNSPQVSRADRISLSPVWSNWLLSPAGVGGGGGGAGPSRSRSEKPARSKQRVTTKLAWSQISTLLLLTTIRNAKANRRNPLERIVKGLGGQRRLFIAALWASLLLRPAFYGSLMLSKHLIKVSRDRKKGRACVFRPRGDPEETTNYESPCLQIWGQGRRIHLNPAQFCSSGIVRRVSAPGKVRLVFPKHPLIAAICLLGGPLPAGPTPSTCNENPQSGANGRSQATQTDHRLANKEKPCFNTKICLRKWKCIIIKIASVDSTSS